MTTPARVVRDTQYAAATVYKALGPTQAGQLAAALVYGPVAAPYARVSQIVATAPVSLNPFNVPKASQLVALAVYATNAGPEARTRAWKFDLDGHTFYVLDLGDTGTFLYDITTQNWCQFITDGFTGWNLRVGTTFGDYNRIAGGDTLYGEVWELDPDATIDEGFRSITHIETGLVATRSRVFMSVDSVRIVGAMGLLMNGAPVPMSLAFSDDNGVTWSEEFTITLTPGDSAGEAAWTSMGSFMSPGRVFRFTDVGGMFRIDGADVFIENFDDQELTNKKYAAAFAKEVNQGG